MSNSSRNRDMIVRDIKESTPMSSKMTLSESSEIGTPISSATALRTRPESPAWGVLTGAAATTAGAALDFALLTTCVGPLKVSFAAGFWAAPPDGGRKVFNKVRGMH